MDCYEDNQHRKTTWSFKLKSWTMRDGSLFITPYCSFSRPTGTTCFQAAPPIFSPLVFGPPPPPIFSLHYPFSASKSTGCFLLPSPIFCLHRPFSSFLPPVFNLKAWNYCLYSNVILFLLDNLIRGPTETLSSGHWVWIIKWWSICSFRLSIWAWVSSWAKSGFLRVVTRSKILNLVDLESIIKF